MLAVTVLAALLVQQPAAPAPFPRAGGPSPQRPAAPAPPSQPTPAQPAPPASTSQAQEAPPGDTQLGVQIYPGAQFLASYDAGRGQRYYLFGSTASFVDVVAFYRTVLKQKGDLVFDVPATHQFEIGRFREETMAFPPSVTVKDFQSQVSQGYPNPRPNAQPARFPTVIQIVPAVTP